MIDITLIDDTPGFEKLKEEWNPLLEASASPCLFLTWEWLFTWWSHLSADRRLCLITVRSGRDLMAIAPLALRPPRPGRWLPFPALEFLGSGIIGSDYLDFIVGRGAEEEACAALADYLNDRKLLLELTQLHRHTCLAAKAAARLQRHGWSCSETATNVCPFINLSGHTWSSYLATLGSEHRYNFGRRVRTLTRRFEMRFEQVGSEAQRRKALAQLVALHNMRWQGRGCSEAFYAPALLSFHEEFSRHALRRGWLRLFVLWLDGYPAASLYGFRYHRTFSFFQSGFDPRYGKHSVGLVTMGLAIKSAIDEGAGEYDMLHGDEPYKFHWARETRELGRLEIYPPGATGWLGRQALRLNRIARKAARRILPHTLCDRIVTGRGLGPWSKHDAAATP